MFTGQKISETENWHIPIQDQFKASYGLLNVECNQAIDEIKFIQI